MNSLVKNPVVKRQYSKKEEMARPSALNDKIKEKIKRALNQINDSKGVIYVIYNLDLNRQIKSLEQRKREFVYDCDTYFNSIKKKNIDLKVLNLNDILN